MAEPHEFGLPGVWVEPGDHICAMYLGQDERDAIIGPWLRAGLRAGDKVVCIIDSSPLDEVVASIGDEQEVEGYFASRQLEMHTAEDTYLRTSPFRSEAMLDFWESTVSAAVAGGSYGFARGSGEMPLELRAVPERTEFFRYEAAVNRFAPRYAQAFLCMYDLQRFGGGFLVDLLRTHPKLLMGGLILENPHYRLPDDLAAPPPN